MFEEGVMEYSEVMVSDETTVEEGDDTDMT